MQYLKSGQSCQQMRGPNHRAPFWTLFSALRAADARPLRMPANRNASLGNTCSASHAVATAVWRPLTWHHTSPQTVPGHVGPSQRGGPVLTNAGCCAHYFGWISCSTQTRLRRRHAAQNMTRIAELVAKSCDAPIQTFADNICHHLAEQLSRRRQRLAQTRAHTTICQQAISWNDEYSTNAVRTPRPSSVPKAQQRHSRPGPKSRVRLWLRNFIMDAYGQALRCEGSNSNQKGWGKRAI